MSLSLEFRKKKIISNKYSPFCLPFNENSLWNFTARLRVGGCVSVSALASLVTRDLIDITSQQQWSLDPAASLCPKYVLWTSDLGWEGGSVLWPQLGRLNRAAVVSSYSSERDSFPNVPDGNNNHRWLPGHSHGGSDSTGSGPGAWEFALLRTSSNSFQQEVWGNPSFWNTSSFLLLLWNSSKIIALPYN